MCDNLLFTIAVISRAPASDTDDTLSRRTSISHTPYQRLHYSSAPRVNIGEMSLPTSPGLSHCHASHIHIYT